MIIRDLCFGLVIGLLASAASAETRVIEKMSKNMDSGHQAQWSPWYILCSDPLPAGFKITSSHFHLLGDRAGDPCGGWSHCTVGTHGPDKVCWNFQMQGHNEPGFRNPLGTGPKDDGVAQSQGVLSITISDGK